MPATKKITREMIVEAGVNVVREAGFGAINARSIAQMAHSSTQPIYKEFSNMTELKQVVREEVYRLTKKMVQEYRSLGEEYEYMAYGLGLVKFAREERQLFRYMFLDREIGEGTVLEPDYDDIIAMMVHRMNLDRETCIRFHQDMTLYTLGLAVTAYNGCLPLTDEELKECFSRQYEALLLLYQ
ncbi:MAG: hypothetical protein ACI4FY_01075 [Acetatifactor sp.]